MSARPGRFIDLVSTGWGHDRDSRSAADPGFARLRHDQGKVQHTGWLTEEFENDVTKTDARYGFLLWRGLGI
jgi:hypothetical protein